MLAAEVEAKGVHRLPPAGGVGDQAGQPMLSGRRQKRLVDDAAGKEDEAAARRGGGVDDLGVAAVGVHAHEQVEVAGHVGVKRPCDAPHARGGRDAHALPVDRLVFVGQGLGRGVDNGRANLLARR